MDTILQFDHIGVVVDDLDQAIQEYVNLNYLGGIDNSFPDEIVKYRVESQKVDLAFMKLSDNSNIELIQADVDTPLYNLRQKGAAFYHIAYKVCDWDKYIGEASRIGLKPIADPFESEAFGGKRCQFFKNNLGHLIEIVES